MKKSSLLVLCLCVGAVFAESTEDYVEKHNAAVIRHQEAHARNVEEHQNKQKQAVEEYQRKQRAEIKAYWAKFREIQGVKLPTSPDSLKIKTAEISKIKANENPDIEVKNALVKNGVSEEQAANIALEIIDSIGVDAVREGQRINIFTENDAKPVVVSLDINSADDFVLLQAKDTGYITVESRADYYTKTASPVSNSKYVFPLKVSYRKTSGFGKRIDPFSRKAIKQHNGVDYAAAKGTDVYSIADGTVIESDSNNVSGNYVVVKHLDGMTSYYLHLNEKGIANGIAVKAGQRIGKLGSTGRSTGPHLHFGIKKHGVWQNPEMILAVN